MKFNKTLASTAAVVALLSAPLAAQADPTLRLTDLLTLDTITVVDQGAGDANSAPNFTTFVGAIPGTSVWQNVSTGTADGAVPATFGIDLNSVNTTSVGAGSLRIEFSEDDLTLADGLKFISGQIGGTLAGGGTISYSLYIDDSNTLFGTGTQIFSGSTSSTPFSDVAGFNANTTGLFSMTLIAEITHTTGGTTSFDFFGTVPEPGSLALAGLALLGLGAASRRKA